MIKDSSFGDHGRTILPADEGCYSGDTLEDLRLTWYTRIDLDKMVEITNYMKNHAENNEYFGSREREPLIAMCL
ncbi:MAG: hypothetical protein K2K44_13410 [Oscillospiraceae bacterium]|nr:hypothetical protein [Oscillospiraceae bacterium]